METWRNNGGGDNICFFLSVVQYLYLERIITFDDMDENERMEYIVAERADLIKYAQVAYQNNPFAFDTIVEKLEDINAYLSPKNSIVRLFFRGTFLFRYLMKESTKLLSSLDKSDCMYFTVTFITDK